MRRVSALIFLLLISIIAIPYTVHGASEKYIIITLKETAGVSRTNYTVPVHIVLDNFPDYEYLTPDTIGILYNNDTPCYFWVERYSTFPNGIDMILYIKVPYIPANGTTSLYLYYNTTEYTSYNDPYHTFKFFTDFSDPSILDNAEIYLHDTANDYVTIENNTLIVHAAGDIDYGAATVQFPVNTELQDTQIIFSASWHHTDLTYPVALVFISDGSTYYYYGNYFPNAGYGYGAFSYDMSLYKFSGGVEALERSGTSTDNDLKQIAYFTRHGTHLVGEGERTGSIDAYDGDFTSFSYLGFLVWCSDAGAGNYIELRVDWIAIRDYLGDDPEVTVTYVSSEGETVTVTQPQEGATNININIAPFANKTYSPIYNLYVDIGIISGIIVAIGVIVYIGLFRDNNRFGVVFMSILIIITAMVGLTRTMILTGEYYINGSVHYIYDYNPISPIYSMLIIVEFGILLMIIFDPIVKKGKKRFLILAS